MNLKTYKFTYQKTGNEIIMKLKNVNCNIPYTYKKPNSPPIESTVLKKKNNNNLLTIY